MTMKKPPQNTILLKGEIYTERERKINIDTFETLTILLDLTNTMRKANKVQFMIVTFWRQIGKQ